MTRLRSQILVPSLAALFILAGCAAGDSATVATETGVSPIVAEFDDRVLTLAEFEEQYARSTGSRADAAQNEFADYVDFLERYVDFRLKVREARRIGLHEDPEIIEEIRTYREQLAQPFLMEREVLDAIIRDIYEKQQEEVAASHILLQVGPHAPAADTLAAFEQLTAIRDSIVAGELDFEEAVMRYSEDPSKAQNRGHLGYFTGGRMILAFEDMAYDTPVGDVSPVFRSQFGYHVLTVTDRRPAEPEIRAAHILIRLDENAPAEEAAEAWDRIRDIQQRLDAGEDFATLAREHSEDPGSAQRGGDLGFFSRDRMVAPFAEAAYALESPGDRSDVVQTQFGLHLIELTERQERQPLNEAYDQIKRLAEQLPRTHQRRLEVGRAHRDQVGSTLNEDVVRQAVAAYHPDSILVKVREQGFGEYADAEFATIGTETFTLGEFAPNFRNVRAAPAPDQAAQIVDLLDQMLDERAVTMAAHTLEERDDEFRRIMADYRDGILLFRLAEDSIWSAAARDTLGLQAFYEEHADNYHFPERHRIIGLYSRADSLIHVAAERLDAGALPAVVAEAINATLEEDDSNRVRLDTLLLASPGGGPFEAAFDLEPGQRTEPVRHRGEHVILYLDGIEDPRPMTFEEARARVITDYQEELDRRLTERLRREAGVRLFPERLTQAFASENGSDASADAAAE